MRAAKSKQKKKNIVLRIALAAFAVYAVIQVVSLRIQIHEKQKEYEWYQTQIQQQELQNEALEENNNHSEEYLEEGARDQGYFLPGEQIFQVVPEN